MVYRYHFETWQQIWLVEIICSRNIITQSSKIIVAHFPLPTQGSMSQIYTYQNKKNIYREGRVSYYPF